MRRLALLAAIAFLVGLHRVPARAELEGQVFTSRPDRLRMIVPRGWRVTDQPTYPGLALWMMRSQPPGQIVLTGEAFTRDLYCSWPPACRDTQEPLTAKYACAIRAKLVAQRLRVGPVQQGPKENASAGLPSVWFEYDDGKRFLRQAVALTQERALSLVLSSPTAEGRAAHIRTFDQALRTIRLIDADEADEPVAPAEPAPAPPADGVRPAPPPIALAPAPRLDPVGACPSAGGAR